MAKRTRPARRPAAASGDAADGHETRRLLLETAGRLCAEKGFERVTGKEICRRAGANPAAVNYHFGGMSALREEVVRDAHRRLVTLDTMSATLAAETDPRERLRAFLGVVVAALTGPSASTWALRILAREITAPSGALDRVHETEILPIQRILRSIVAGVTGRSEDDPVVARGCVTVMGPCFMFLVADRRLLQKSFPGAVPDPADAAALARQLATSAIAGLEAIAAPRADARPAPRRRPTPA